MKIQAIYQAPFEAFDTELETLFAPPATRDTMRMLMADPTITQYVSGVMARIADTPSNADDPDYDFEGMDTYSLCDGHDRMELADDHAQFLSDIADYGEGVVGAVFILFDHGVMTAIVYAHN
jgi:hypothetical protein